MIVMHPNLGASVVSCGVIEVDLFAFGNEGIVDADKTKSRFSPRSIGLLHNGPAKSSGCHIFLVRSEVLVLQ